MAIIVEQNELNHLGVKLEVLEHEKWESYEDGEVIDIEIDTFRSYTPDELIEIGNWLIQNSKRIKDQYDGKGKKKIP